MSVDTRIRRLLDHWRELLALGQPVSAEELCRDCPELLDELRRHLEQIPEGENAAAILGRLSPTSPFDASGPTLVAAANHRSAAPPAGCRVAGYEILGELGRGGMGVVYKARQPGLNRLVALKMIRDGALAGPQQHDSFKSEAEAIAHLRHPSIVHVYEFGFHEGLPFFSMELVEGGSLAHRLAGRPLPPRDAARLVETLAHAIEHAHQRRIIHRDLKPMNVLMTAEGLPKVSDFGLAKRLDAATSTHGHLKGTPCYMAPEQVSGGARRVGPAADIYSLGAILYELLTGRPPFESVSLAELLDQVRFHKPRRPRDDQPDIPRDLEQICLRCLEKEPERRHPSAAALARDLAAFLAGQPISAPSRPSSASQSWATRAGYEIEALLERRDWMAFYRARSLRLDRMAYLKVISARADEAKRSDFLHEIGVLSQVRHPNLPEFFEANELDDRAFLAYECADGLRLLRHVTKHGPSLPELVRLMEALCRVVHFAHQQGVMHQDLRPDNVQVLENGGLKLYELGLPRPPDESDDPSMSQLLNLLRYKAPEQMDEDPVPIDVGINVYTLGTIFYEMLTGKPPFKFRSLFAAADQLRNEAPLPPSSLNPLVPPRVDAVCLKCLAKAPAQRYRTAAALAEDLRRFLETV